MGAAASAAAPQTLEDLVLSETESEHESSGEEEVAEEAEGEEPATQTRRKRGQAKLATKKGLAKGKKKIPRNVVTDEMRNNAEMIPEIYRRPEEPPSKYTAFWRPRLGPLNDMLKLDGSLKKQKRPAHGGIKGAPQDKWADGGKKEAERERRANMTEAEKAAERKVRKKEEREKKRKQASFVASQGSKQPLILGSGGSSTVIGGSTVIVGK